MDKNPRFEEVDPSQSRIFNEMAQLAPRLRPQDAIQLEAVHGYGPLMSLLIMSRCSGPDMEPRVWMVYDRHNNPQAMFGLLLEPDACTLWLVGTNWVYQKPLTFLRGAKRWMKDVVVDLRPLILASVWKDNNVNIDFLKWLGFTVDTSETITYHSPEVEFYQCCISNTGDNK